MIDASTPLREVVAAMLNHDGAGASEFLARQKPDALANLLAAAELLRSESHAMMLRDVPAFMAFKSPSSPEPVALDVFRPALEAALTHNLDELRQVLSPLSLVTLSGVMSLGGTLAFLWQTRSSNPLLQSRHKPEPSVDALFPD